MKKFLKNFTQLYIDALRNDIDYDKIEEVVSLIKITNERKGKLIFVGNGGSAAMASHVAVDFTKNAKIRSINFNEADLLTCFGNDFGYENWVKESLNFYADKDDLIFLISSSGNSMNMINAAKFCEKNSLKYVTLSGFDIDNKLYQKGDVRFWVDSKEYNIVEMTHHIILLLIVDFFINEK